MNIKKITQDLTDLFAAPLPDFYKRRIVFWHDEEREFESMPDRLDIPGVTVVKLTGTNNFAVKKLLLHDDLTGNYLIYDPFPHERQQDNWLRDIELFSDEYHADYYSILMTDLHIVNNAKMRQTVKLYEEFFKNGEFTEKLKKAGRVYERPLELHVAVMGVLAGLPGNCSRQDLYIAVLEQGTDEEHNKALNAIKQYGSIQAFWELVRHDTGFIRGDGTPLRDLAPHILLTALAQTMNVSVLKGLNRYISLSNTAFCYSVVDEWRRRKDNSGLFRLCRDVEHELNHAERFERQEIETLLTGDVFPAIHETILKRFFDEAADGVIKTDLIFKTVDNRRMSGWGDRFAAYYDCLSCIAKMQQFYQANVAGFHLTQPWEVWKFYCDKGSVMDTLYRHFHVAFDTALNDRNSVLEDSLRRAAGYVEGLYQNWFLKNLSDCWVNAAADDLTNRGFVPDITRQRDFYERYVRPVSRVFVIVSDGLRYETARELCAAITQSNRGSAKVESMQASFPSITKFGMASLLPGRTLSLDENLNVLVDGLPTRSTAEREKILCADNEGSVALRYIDVKKMPRAERRERIKGKSVVYIYHNTIDAMGDKRDTEEKVFAACADAIEELTSLVRIIVNDFQGTDVIITADHGFLYTYKPLAEQEKLSANDAFSGTVYEYGRRYAIAAPGAEAEYLLPVRMDVLAAGAPVRGFTPRGTTRIMVSGGGENYVHGGISLQETVVPVIVYKNRRSVSKEYVPVRSAELRLLSESRKVTNLVFALDFYQPMPTGEKVKPCAYSVYMTDDEGRKVSDTQVVIADRADKKESQRTFRVHLSLKAGTYDRNKIYRLVIENGTDIPQEVDFHIDIAFADDFGFDL